VDKLWALFGGEIVDRLSTGGGHPANSFSQPQHAGQSPEKFAFEIIHRCYNDWFGEFST
jgi:hypothetical protein